MYIYPDSLTSPPLTLAIDALSILSRNQPRSNNSVLELASGSGALVNLGNLDPSLASMPVADQLASLVALGQMLWRYVPIVAESIERIAPSLVDTAGAVFLDSESERRRYAEERNLSYWLPDGTSVQRLAPLLTRTLMRNNSIARRMVRRQRSLNRTRIGGDNRNYIADYTSLPSIGSTYFSGQSAVGRRVLNGMKYITPDVAMTRGVRELFDNPIPKVTLPTNANVLLRSTRAGINQAFLQHAATTPITHLPARRSAHSLEDCGSVHSDVMASIFDGGHLRAGEFFSTPNVHATLAPLGAGNYGQIDVGSKPYEITINSEIAFPRAQLSLVHELLHMFADMYKIDLPHHAVHELALVLFNEIMPALEALTKYTGS